MNLRVNRDGKLWDRVVGAAIPLAIGLLPVAFLWWRDAGYADVRANEAITRIEVRIDKVEAEAREARKAASDNRQKIAEMAAVLRKTEDGVSRINNILDRWAGPPSRP